MTIGRARRIVTPPCAGEPPPGWMLDGSVLALFATNVVALLVAEREGWSVWSLMMVYWAQSVIIGIINVIRILSLDRFSTKDFRIDGRLAEPTPAVKRQTALFFAIFYFGCHALYFVFVYAHIIRAAPLVWQWLWACVAAFAVNHLWSFLYNLRLDRQGTTNVGTLMFTPFLRIVPMHLVIIFGSLFAPGTSLVIFGALKTLADVLMHFVEHARIQARRPSIDPG